MKRLENFLKFRKKYWVPSLFILLLVFTFIVLPWAMMSILGVVGQFAYVGLFMAFQVFVWFGVFFYYLAGRIRQNKIMPGDLEHLSWDDYRGQPQLVERSRAWVDYLKGVKKFEQMGGEYQPGILMLGPPGSGKTWLAKIMAAEAGIPFVSVEANSLLGCVTGDTLVTTEQGIVELSSLGKQTADIDLTVAGKNGSAKATLFYAPGSGPTLHVRSKEGISITGTHNHPLLVMGDDGVPAWRRLDEITPGDYLAIKRGTDMWGTDDTLTIEDAYELGLYVAEGWRRPDGGQGIIIANSEPAIIDFLRGRGYTTTGERGIHHANYHSRIAGWAEPGTKAAQKSIPEIVMRSTRAIVVAFLRGLFDGDGHGHKARGSVVYSSVSEKLIRQLQAVLLNFGIVGRVYQTKSELGDGLRLDIEGRDAELFYTNIGFRLGRKQAARSALANTRIFKDDAVPSQGQIVKRLCYAGKRGREGPVKYGKPAAVYIEKFRNCWRQRRGRNGGKISYDKLRELLDIRQDLIGTPDYAHLAELIELNYYWAEVQEVEEAPMSVVYDLHVPESHSFVANGIVSHNTFIGI